MLTKRRNGQASRTSLQALMGAHRTGAHRPADLPAPLRPHGRRHGRARRLPARHRPEGRGDQPAAARRADRAQEEHLHPLLGRLHRHRRGPERRLDRPGALLGQPVQPRLALRQGRQRARARAQRPPAQVPDEARRRPVGAHLLGGGDRRDRRQAARDPRELRAGVRLLDGIGQVLQRGHVPLPQARRALGDQQPGPPGAHLPFDHRRRRRQHLGLRRDDQLLQRHPQLQDDAGPAAATRPRRTRSRCSTCSRARS